ncbi:hypothetical protein [Kocuria atrinae]|uniref:hypothetical protein n=1 Tax=Kocuria atrinae TaxID=592377 RepID=UPI0021D4168B|nr:hypothetical protein [Kocuria atrinae]
MPLTRLAAHAQVSVRTLQRWAAEYRADSSAAGLQRKARSDRGQRRLPAELIAVIEAWRCAARRRRPGSSTAGCAIWPRSAAGHPRATRACAA